MARSLKVCFYAPQKYKFFQTIAGSHEEWY
jgi:hypothetical protein